VITIPMNMQVTAKERSDVPMISDSEVNTPTVMRSHRTRWAPVRAQAPMYEAPCARLEKSGSPTGGGNRTIIERCPIVSAFESAGG
jgi:hypothetical protein